MFSIRECSYSNHFRQILSWFCGHPSVDFKMIVTSQIKRQQTCPPPVSLQVPWETSKWNQSYFHSVAPFCPFLAPFLFILLTRVLWNVVSFYRAAHKFFQGHLATFYRQLLMFIKQQVIFTACESLLHFVWYLWYIVSDVLNLSVKSTAFSFILRF